MFVERVGNISDRTHASHTRARWCPNEGKSRSARLPERLFPIGPHPFVRADFARIRPNEIFPFGQLIGGAWLG
jgi:hypothetical protein